MRGKYNQTIIVCVVKNSYSTIDAPQLLDIYFHFRNKET